MLYFFKIEKDAWKNQNFEKMKKLLDISFYTCVPKTKIIWGSAVSEIEWDRQIFCTFALFFALLPQKIKAYDDVIILYMCTKKSPSYGVWLLRYGCNHTIFCHFGSFFALLLHYWPQILKIEKKRRYFLFHMCTINKDYRDIRHNRLKFLSFWTIFCPFFPLTNQNIKILKKWKKNPWRYFTYVYHEWQSYDVRFLRYGVQQAKSFLILDFFLLFYCLEISSAYTCVPQMTNIWCMVP